MSANENKLITIGGCQAFSKVLNSFWYIGLSIYFTYSYTTIPSDLTDETLTNLFLITTIIYWLVVFVSFLNLACTIKYIGATMHEKYFEAVLPENQKPLSYLKIVHILHLGIGIYYVTIFTPVNSDNCDIYANVHHACQSLQIITVLVWIVLGFLAVAAIPVVFCCPCIFCGLLGQLCEWFLNREWREQARGPRNAWSNNPENQNGANGATGATAPTAPLSPTRASSFAVLQRQGSLARITNNSIVRSYLQISTAAPDCYCAICMEDPKDGDKWKILPCTHKFHPDCIDTWSATNPTCPLCRGDIPVNSVEATSQV